MIPALAVLAALLAAEGAAPEPDPPVAALEEVGEGARKIKRVKSPLALVRRADGGTDILGLGGGGSANEPAPWQLWRLRGADFSILREFPPEPGIVGPLAADVDGDGREDVVLFTPGRALLLRSGADGSYTGDLERLVEDDGLDVQNADLRLPAGVTLEGGRLCTGVVGALRCWSGRGETLPWPVSLEVPLPIALARGREGLRLTGMPVQRLPGPELVFAAGFKAEGPERLRVVLVAPGAPEATHSTECWLRLPAPERVLEHAFFRLDGRPALAVTTIPAGSLSLFGEKRIRVWLLAPDRTRTGKLPVLAATSNMNLWQGAHWFPHDVDADSREDLVLGYWKGLKDSRVVLDPWLQKADGTFARGSAGAAFDVEKGDRGALRWGTDADGDGRPDLVVIADGALEVHPGVEGKGFVSKKPGQRVPVGRSGEGDMDMEISFGGDSPHQAFPLFTPYAEPIRPADLDGDGDPEWLVLPTAGHPSLIIVSLPR